MLIFCFNSVFAATEKQFITPDEVQESLKFADEPFEIQNARNEVFYSNINIPYKTDTSKYQKYFIDKSYNSKKHKTAKWKNIGYYSNGYYEWFKNGIWLRFIYENGKILFIRKEIYNNNKDIFIDFLYEPNGNLKYIHYITKDKINNNFWWTEYVFDTKKNYLGKWDKGTFYSTKNTILLHRGSNVPFK